MNLFKKFLQRKLLSLILIGLIVEGFIAFINITHVFGQPSITLKWRKNAGTSSTWMGPLAADLNNDGLMEIVITGLNGVAALDPISGNVIWSMPYGGGHCPFEIIDLNKDGIPEIVMSTQNPIDGSSGGVLALHGNNGSLYWRNPSAAGKDTYIAVADINADGYPEIFSATPGKVTALTYDGRIFASTWTYYSCWGGLTVGDTDFDGVFEVYLGERSESYPRYPSGGRGLRAFWADNLTERWCYPDILCSSQAPVLADVDKDGDLEIIILNQSPDGIAVINTDGSVNTYNGIYRKQNNLGLTTHTNPTIADVDDDGNLELIVCGTSSHEFRPPKIWDLVDWKLDATLPFGSIDPPGVADIEGDGKLEIIAPNQQNVTIFKYNPATKNYDIIYTIPITMAHPFSIAQDIDADGKLELVFNQYNSWVCVYDVEAPAPTPLPRSGLYFYSEYRTREPVYVPPPEQPPKIAEISPSDGATNVSVSLSELSFKLTDYQSDPMDYTVTTNPDIGSDSGINVPNGEVAIPVSGLANSTTYTWTVTATDGTHTTTRTFTFYTPWIVDSDPPTHDAPLLVSSHGTNMTDEELICYNQTTTDPEGDEVTNIYHWIRDGNSITNLLMSFDTTSSATAPWEPEKCTDNSGYGNDGTVFGATWTSDGVVGGAYEFDGDDYIVIPDDPSLGGTGTWTEITVEFWVKAAAPLHGTRLVDNTLGGTGNYMVGFQTSMSDPANTLFWGITVFGGGFEELIYYGESLAVDTWYHVVCTYESGPGLTLYLDGAERINMPLTGNIDYDVDQQLFLGYDGEGGANRYLDGTLDEVRIYPFALTPAQIFQRFIETKDGFSSSSTIVPQETSAGEVWTCEVIPNDSWQDGTAKTSNPLTVLAVSGNSRPRIDLYTPTETTPEIYEGTNLNFTHISSDPDGDTLFYSWLLDSVEQADTENWNYSPGYGDAGTHNVTLVVSDGALSDSQEWTVTVVRQYELFIGVVGNGTTSPAPGTYLHDEGSSVSVTALPDSGWMLSHWILNESDVGDANPYNLTITSNYNLTAVFVEIPSVQYELVIGVMGNGTTSPSPGSHMFAAGTEVNLTAVADPGWAFSEWTGDLTGSENPTTIVMDGNKTVNATFVLEAYILTVNVVGNGTVSKDPDLPSYSFGDVVTLNATADLGWSFSAWSGDLTGSENPKNITMDGDKTVNATFIEEAYTLTVNTVGNGSVLKDPDQPTYAYGTEVNLTAFTDLGWSFSEWSGDASGTETSTIVTMDGDKTVNATFIQEFYTLTVNVFGNGSVTRDPDQPTYAYGTEVNLTATSDLGWAFSEWSGGLTGSENPTTITMDGDKVVNATFIEGAYTLTINVFGNGSVTKDPDQLTYGYGTEVNLTATPDLGWAFSGWSGDASGTDPLIIIIMDGNKIVNATFTQLEYTLTVNIFGNGTVTLNNTGPYYFNDVVELTAEADPGWTFSEWSGDASGTDPLTSITMDGNKTVNATFVQEAYTLTVNVFGNGSVTKDPDLPTYTYGTEVNLTASPDLGWAFGEWSGDASGSDFSTVIIMDGNKTVNATFIQEFYTLTVNVFGNGSVSKAPDQPTYAYGTEVNLTAVADLGWAFSEWSGDASGTDPITITIVDSNKTVNATFVEAAYTLTVNVFGNGSVTKYPDQPTYTYGTEVNLTASPDLGWTFSEWSGDASGTNTLTSVFMDGNKTVNATFIQEAYTLTVNILGNGSVTKDPDQPTYTYGTEVNLTATSDLGWAFSQWSGDASGTDPLTTITMDGDKTVNATFIQEFYTLTINIFGNGSVTKDPEQPTYTYGTEVNLTASADLGWAFFDWTGDAFGTEASTSVVMDGNKTVNATFIQEAYTLTVNVFGNGTVSKDPDQPTYTYGAEVNLTASADPGWTFSEWTGDASGTDVLTTVYMDRNKTVNATFIQEAYTLIVNIFGNGSVAKDPDLPTYTYGTEVNLAASPDLGWAFSEWSGDASGTGTLTTVFMDGNKTVNATFIEEAYTLTVNVFGNGSVTKDPDLPTYTYGIEVNLTATPDLGWTFSEWTGDASGSDPLTTVLMDGSKTLNATFIQEAYTLTINIFGNGSVTKDPEQPTYTYGTEVNLTATPDAGWSFSEWTGDASGTNPLTTVFMDGNKTVNATFIQEAYTLTINVFGNGTVTKDPDQSTYTYGTEVNLTASADLGWAFSEWSGDASGTDQLTTVFMDGNKIVNATFTQLEYILTVNIVGNGTVTLNNTGPYYYLDVVELTAVADPGWTFSEWSVDLSGSANPENITMDGDKTVNAIFVLGGDVDGDGDVDYDDLVVLAGAYGSSIGQPAYDERADFDRDGDVDYDDLVVLAGAYGSGSSSMLAYIWNPAAASNVYPAMAYPNATYVEVWIDSPDAWFNTSSGIVGVTVSLGVNSSVVEVLTTQAMPDMDFGGFPDSFLGDFLEDAHPLDSFTTFFAVGTVDKPNGTITATADIILDFTTLGVGAGSGPKPLWRWVIRTQSGVDHTTAYSPLTILDAYYTTVDGVNHPISIVESGHYGTPPP